MRTLSKTLTVFIFYTISFAFAFDDTQKISNISLSRDCQLISDSYFPEGLSQSNTPLSEKYKHPRIGWREFGFEELDPQIAYVSLFLDDHFNISIKAYDANSKLLVEKKFIDEPVTCENGSVIFTRASKGGSGESGAIESHTTIAYARSNSCQLVVHHTQIDIYRRLLLFKHEETFETWTVYNSINCPDPKSARSL